MATITHVMRRLDRNKRAMIIGALVEGNSINFSGPDCYSGTITADGRISGILYGKGGRPCRDRAGKSTHPFRGRIIDGGASIRVKIMDGKNRVVGTSDFTSWK